MSEKHFVPVQTILPPMPCQWSVGIYMEKFYQDLGEKKFSGIACGKCKKVYVPPRKYCSECHAELKKWVKVESSGEVTNFTTAYQNVNGSRREKPVILGLVRLDGADTDVFGELRGITPEGVKIGMRVKAVFADKPGVTVESVSHFEPAGKK